jgi:hypothetical protein
MLIALAKASFCLDYYADTPIALRIFSILIGKICLAALSQLDDPRPVETIRPELFNSPWLTPSLFSLNLEAEATSASAINTSLIQSCYKIYAGISSPVMDIRSGF